MEKSDQLPFLLAGGNSKLKDRLKESAPELYKALERSWTIAWNEWLPALGAKNDSFNSFPHIKSLEYYLDEVILGFEPLSPSTKTFISPTEIYVILSAILLHDIGKIYSGNGKGKTRKTSPPKPSKSLDEKERIMQEIIDGKKSHEETSYHLINFEWNYLGICSHELAKSIAKICRYHDSTVETDDWNERTQQLNNVVIDPYGEIRERWLGSLLVLVDHMDGAFTRVLPRYTHKGRSLQIIGAFREVIRGVYVDPIRQMVKTVIGDDLYKKEDDPKQSYLYSVNLKGNNRLHNLTEDTLTRISKKKWDTKLPANKYSDFIKEIYSQDKKELPEEQKTINTQGKLETINEVVEEFDITYKTQGIEKPDKTGKTDKTDKTEGVKKFDKFDWLIYYQALYVEIANPTLEWDSNKLLAMIVGDAYENNRTLNLIKDSLATNGIILNAWLIDFQEHLFTVEGQETHEPIYSADYLARVIDKMWELCSTIINPGYFSYETLASKLRDPDLERVKTAVRRICIVIGTQNHIWAGENGWKWGKSSGKEKFDDCKTEKEEYCKIVTSLDKPEIQNPKPDDPNAKPIALNSEKEG